MGDDDLDYMEDRTSYTPSQLSIKPGEAVAMIYYSFDLHHYRLHDGIYYGPPGLKDDGKAHTLGTFHIVHYRMKKGHMCHELLTGHAGNGYIVKILRTRKQAYSSDPAFPNQPAPSSTKGCPSIIPKGTPVAVKTANDVKNGRLVHATCRNFPNYTGRVQINHFKLTHPEEHYKKNNPPPNSEIKGYSHTLSHVTFVEVPKLSTENTCKLIK